jgi:hypothetical protein
MSGYVSRYRHTGGGGSRWMNLRYAGTCKVCAQSLPAGTNAYWDASARTVTCSAIACAQADGLTQVTERWAGNPDGKISLRAYRVGSPAPVHPQVVVTRFNSGATTYRNARGRCEDASCCGCCD